MRYFILGVVACGALWFGTTHHWRHHTKRVVKVKSGDGRVYVAFPSNDDLWWYYSYDSSTPVQTGTLPSGGTWAQRAAPKPNEVEEEEDVKVDEAMEADNAPA